MYDGMCSNCRDDVDGAVSGGCEFAVSDVAYDSGGTLQIEPMLFDVMVELMGVGWGLVIQRYGLKTSLGGKDGGAERGFDDGW